MKKRRLISLLLILSNFLTVMMPGPTAYAVNGEDGSNSGMVIKKEAWANPDNTYTIQLEAYATGDKVITETKKDIPTDIILVLDQSGSMSDPIGEVSFKPYIGMEITGATRTIMITVIMAATLTSTIQSETVLTPLFQLRLSKNSVTAKLIKGVIMTKVIGMTVIPIIGIIVVTFMHFWMVNM